jgi:hypothetical protein
VGLKFRHPMSRPPVMRTAAVLVLAAAGLCALGACTFSVGGGKAQEQPRPKQAAFERNENLARELIAGINLEGGVGYSDATHIANYYLSHHANSRGVLMSLAEADRVWEGRVLIKATGTTVDALLRVDKATGGVTWGLGPSVRNLQELMSR